MTETRRIEVTDEVPVGPGDGRIYTVDDERWWAEPDDRQRRLLDGALTVAALTHPDRPLRVLALHGATGSLPETAGHWTRRVTWSDESVPLCLLSIARRGKPGGEPLTLVVDLGSDDLTPPQAVPLTPSVARRLLFAARARVPVGFDVLRQWRTDRLEERRQRRPLPRARSVPRDPEHPPGDRPAAVLFGLHWLELGGAERWALECIRTASELGMVPIVLTDRPSSSPWVTRPEMADAVFLPLNHQMPAEDQATLLAQVFGEFDVRGVHVHHSTWLYERLPWIRAHHPGVPIVDSLHIREWRTGGFVDIAVRFTDVIDVHHVISPELRDHLVGRMGVPQEKVALATLADLSPVSTDPVAPRREQPAVIAFVGRLTQQKRPYLFVRLAALVHRELPDVRFILHGSGELGGEIRAMIRRLGLQDVVEQRASDHPVSATLTEADVLVVSSDNEGVTLTTFEADAHDVLVLSADVGSQRSVVVEDLLCPRHTLGFLSTARARLVTAVRDTAARERWAAEQRRKVTAFTGLPRARTWTSDLYRGWNA